MAKYQVKLSVLLDSLEYYSDIESDGYYIVQGSNEIVEYGEGLSEEYCYEDELWDSLKSKVRLQLPTLRDLDNSAPNWSRDTTMKYIDVMIADEKQKKLLTKAYKAVFNNRIWANRPGSEKFNKELGGIGRKEEFERFVKEECEAHQMKFLTAWCQENDVEILNDV